MDNFTHSLAGWALGQAGLKTKTRKGLAALILAANMPDIDVFFGHSCWTPLAIHRGFTHSLVGGTLVLPPILAGLLWLLDRWQLRRGAVFESGLAMHGAWLVALCFIGALTHPLLDLLTSYSVQLLSPFSNLWFHQEALFIIDVWLWSVLSFGIWLSRRREKAGGAWRKPARIALGVALIHISVNLMLTWQAKQALRARAPAGRTETVFARMEPVIFWRRGLVYRGQGEIGRASWSPLRGLELDAGSTPDNMGDPLVRKAMFATPELVRFMRWSVMPVATVDRRRCSARISFTDARFGAIRVPWGRNGDPFRHDVAIPIAGDGCRANGQSDRG